MNRPMFLTGATALLATVGVLSLGEVRGASCAGCAAPMTQQPVALLPGDSGPCTTVVTSLLPDGGAATSFTTCNFTGK